MVVSGKVDVVVAVVISVTNSDYKVVRLNRERES